MTDVPIALEAYEELAEAYAGLIDKKPHNAFYERPATLSLIPDVADSRVLDAGCGSGIYSELLTSRGAEVTSVDASPRMLDFARQRLGEDADIRRMDVGKTLPFETAEFDFVLASLVLDYIENWYDTFSEFHRILRPGGYVVFSVSHPFSDYLYFRSEDYFLTERAGSEWRGFKPAKVFVPCYRRSLGAMFEPLTDAGFRVDKVIEPRPTQEFKEADPRHYEELSRFPAFLCIRATR